MTQRLDKSAQPFLKPASPIFLALISMSMASTQLVHVLLLGTNMYIPL